MRTWPPSVPGVLPVAVSQLNSIVANLWETAGKPIDHMTFRDTSLVKQTNKQKQQLCSKHDLFYVCLFKKNTFRTPCTQLSNSHTPITYHTPPN